MVFRSLAAVLLAALAVPAFSQVDTTLWSQAYYANNNETALKLDSQDNVYLAYVTGTPAQCTIKKFSPTGAVLWSNTIPYQAKPETRMQIVIGPDGDPYIGWASTVAELRRINKLTGKVKWTITPPMQKFRFAVYEKVSVYGDRQAGSVTAAQVLSYTLDGKLTASTGFESGFQAGEIWDGLITHDEGTGPVTERMLVKTRANSSGTHVLIGNQSYLFPLIGTTELTVNQASPESEIIVGGPGLESMWGSILRYGEGVVAQGYRGFNYLPSLPDTRVFFIGSSPVAPYRAFAGSHFSSVGFDSRTPLVGSDNITIPTGTGHTAYAMDRMGQIHWLKTQDGVGTRLNDRTLLQASTQARSPQIAIDSKGDAVVSYIRQNGSPAVVVSKVKLGIVAWLGLSPVTRRDTAVAIDLRHRALGYDDGTNDSHFVISQPPANGSVELNELDEVIYTPAPGFVGSDPMRYTVSKPGSSVEGGFTIFVMPRVTSFTVTDGYGGGYHQATITYDGPAASAERFDLKAIPASALQTTGYSISFSDGATTSSVTLRSAIVNADTVVTMQAASRVPGETLTTTFTVRRAALEDLTIPAEIVGGNSFQARVDLFGYAHHPGITVALSDDSPLITTPASMTISTGNEFGLKNCGTLPVVSETQCSVTATYDSVSKTKTIILSP